MTMEILVRGNFTKVTESVTVMSASAVAVVRPDLKYVEDDVTYVPIFMGEKAMGKEQCVANETTADELKEAIDAILGGVAEPQVFDRSYDGEFKGTKCTVYQNDTGDDYLKYFVDKDNYLIGMESKSFIGVTVTTVTYSYDVSLKDFVLDKSDYDDCNTSVYEAPDSRFDECPSSSSASSDSSTIRAAFLLVLLCAALALF